MIKQKKNTRSKKESNYKLIIIKNTKNVLNLNQPNHQIQK